MFDYCCQYGIIKIEIKDKNRMGGDLWKNKKIKRHHSQ
jgi:hypothetical protein